MGTPSRKETSMSDMTPISILPARRWLYIALNAARVTHRADRAVLLGRSSARSRRNLLPSQDPSARWRHVAVKAPALDGRLKSAWLFTYASAAYFYWQLHGGNPRVQ